ncbi:solute carrier family 22 member 7-like [Amblyomma americanum]
MKPRADGSPDHTVLQESVYVILGHGRLQQLALLSTILSLILLLMHAFAYRLIGRPVDHWCQPPPDFRDLPAVQWKNVAIPVLADGSFSRCTVYDPPVPDDSQEERRVVPCDRWDYDTTDIGNSVVSMWDLVCEHKWLYYISSSVYMLGSLCLVPVAGIMADRVGLRLVILASAATMLLATMAAGSTQAFGVFLMARFLVSATASATNVLNFIVLYELTGNEHRALYILLANSVGTTVPPVLYSLLSLLRPSWSLSHALFVAASAIVLACCYSLEESPVWQLATWRIRQAQITMLQAAKSHSVDMAKARSNFRALKRQLEKGETASVAGTGASGRMSLAASFRRRAVSIFLSWFAVIFACYDSRTGRMSLESYWEVSADVSKILILIAVYYLMKNRGQRVTLSAVLIACKELWTSQFFTAGDCITFEVLWISSENVASPSVENGSPLRKTESHS